MRSIAYGTLILAIFFLINFGVRPLVLNFVPAKESYVRWGLVAAIEVVAVVIAVMALFRSSLFEALQELRLTYHFLAAVKFGMLVTAPMLVAFAFSGWEKGSADYVHIGFSSFVSPLAEEMLFRGFAVWMLYRFAGWDFWTAVLIPAVVFGYGHLDQSADQMQSLAIFAITALGSIWFSWLLLSWNNLWVPIIVHSLMNLWWEIFDVDTTALGGWLPNGMRLAVVILSIIVTLLYAHKGLDEFGVEVDDYFVDD